MYVFIYLWFVAEGCQAILIALLGRPCKRRCCAVLAGNTITKCGVRVMWCPIRIVHVVTVDHVRIVLAPVVSVPPLAVVAVIK